ncbi:MAG: hypothetical protein OXU81_19670 [Gammaproteobacteria bacterium]|nr:hypothetical protein [Gammaproteobacteria bacterium]
MTTCTLPPDPHYCFSPAYRPRDEPQPIDLVFDQLSGSVPTGLVAYSLDEAERLCDVLNARLGLDRSAWMALVARSMRPASLAPAPGLH